MPDLQPVGKKDGALRLRVDRADLHPPDRLWMGAEEREHARRGDDADGLSAKEKAVPAVRKSPPCHRTAARRQAAAID